MINLVSDHIRLMLSRQVTEHGVVVWYDPGQVYSSAIRKGGGWHFDDHINVFYFDGSYYNLRCTIDEFLNGSTPPHLLIYIPTGQDRTNNALIGIESLGVVMKPGQQPPARNTRLSIVARNALRPIFGDDAMASIEKQINEGQLTLRDLDTLAKNRGGRGVIAIIFGNSMPRDVCLAFLSSPDLDKQLLTKRALPELLEILAGELEFKFDLPTAPTPNGEEGFSEVTTIREELAKHVLYTDLHAHFFDELPANNAAIAIPQAQQAREACTSIATIWRHRRDLRNSFAESTKKIAGSLNLGADENAFSHRLLGQLLSGHRESIPDTFLEVEVGLQQAVVARFLDSKDSKHQALVDFTTSRLSSFWSEHIPDVQARWALIGSCGTLLVEATHVKTELKDCVDSSSNETQAAYELFTRYTTSDRPWCLLDTYHRRMERRNHDFTFSLSAEHEQLVQLITVARRRYMGVGSELTEMFTRALEPMLKKGHSLQLQDAPKQTAVYERFVRPHVSDEKVAYVWVDALRFEMARELSNVLSTDYEVEFQPVI